MENNSTRDQVPVTQLQQEEKYLPELPEGCITQVISFTSCRDACVSACVSREFRSAADSDSVWEKFLPPDYTDILPRTVPPLSLTDFSSKKELFFYFCSDLILLDGGTKSINFDKDTGKKCITIGARELGITWGDTPDYWKWRPHSESRFAEVAELIDVCWLEMRGKIETRMLSTKTRYGVYLVIKHADETYGLEDPPVDVWVTYVEGEGTASGLRNIYLERIRRQRRRGQYHRPVQPNEGVFPSQRADGWMEIDMGEFYNDQGEDGEVQMHLLKHGAWKRGLIVEGIQFRPKANSI